MPRTRLPARDVLLAVLPRCWVCPDCGPFAAADEDGLCASCGAPLLERNTASYLKGGRDG